MRRGLLILVSLGALLAAAWFIYTSVLPQAPLSDLEAAPKPKQKTAQPVQTMIVRHGTIAQHISATGTILPEAKVDVFPRAEGHLHALQVEVGDRVQAGQIIARIADAELRAGVARSAAQVDALRAEWAQMQAGAVPEEIAQAEDRVQHAEAELANAQGFLERTQAMVTRGLQSAQELDDATRRVTQARAASNTAQKRLQLLRSGARVEERHALQARIRASRAAQRLTETELQSTVITAPMAGIVSRRYVDLGAYMTSTTTPIVTLVAMEMVKIRVPISERDIGRVRPGLSAEVRVDAYPDDIFTGTVRRISPTIDPTSHSGEVEISLANTDYRIKPGMFAKVAITVEQRQDVVVVPRDALRRDGDVMIVFIVQDGLAHQRQVTTGLQNENVVEIRDGLTPGTTIVLSGHHTLKDQATVKVVQAQE